LIRAICTVAVISIVDWRVEGNISLGFLYLFPMVLMGTVLSQAQLALAAAVCMVLAEWFDPFPWTPEAGGPRDIMMFSAFLGMGLFVMSQPRTALQGSNSPELKIAAGFENGRVVVRFRDNGPGVANPAQLFQPFQRGAESTGLGLYLSRAFLRSFKGELRHEPQSRGCCFVLELTPMIEAGDDTSEHVENSRSSVGRSHAVP
jgi:hypothetical protein